MTHVVGLPRFVVATTLIGPGDLASRYQCGRAEMNHQVARQSQSGGRLSENGQIGW